MQTRRSRTPAVRAFGERIRAEHPNASFMINIQHSEG